MKLTLLELVQDMLEAIDSENVTDVAETEEAQMCVGIANRCFEDMITKRRWRHLKGYRRLSTTTALNEMTVPSGTIALDPYNVWYDGQRVSYCSPEEFLALTIGRDVDETNIVASNDMNVYNDRNPTWFTSDDDETLIFDAYPDSVNGLAASDTRVLAYVGPTSRLSVNGDYFDLPGVVFPALDKYCIATAVGSLKGDSTEAQRLMAEYKRTMSALGRTSKLIDVREDTRKWIVPRSRAGASSSPIYYGQRVIV